MNTISLAPRGQAVYPDFRFGKLLTHGEQGYGGPYLVYEARVDSSERADGKSSENWFSDMFTDSPFKYENLLSCLLGTDDSCKGFRDARRILADKSKVQPTLLPASNAQIVALVFRPGDVSKFRQSVAGAVQNRQDYARSLEVWAKQCLTYEKWFTGCTTNRGERASGVFQHDVGPKSGHWKKV